MAGEEAPLEVRGGSEGGWSIAQTHRHEVLSLRVYVRGTRMVEIPKRRQHASLPTSSLAIS